MANDMPKKRDEESGQFTETVSDDEIIEFVREHTGGTTTSDVAEHVGWEHATAYRRLKKLEGEDRIKSRDVGGSLLWSVAEED